MDNESNRVNIELFCIPSGVPGYLFDLFAKELLSPTYTCMDPTKTRKHATARLNNMLINDNNIHLIIMSTYVNVFTELRNGSFHRCEWSHMNAKFREVKCIVRDLLQIVCERSIPYHNKTTSRYDYPIERSTDEVVKAYLFEINEFINKFDAGQITGPYFIRHPEVIKHTTPKVPSVGIKVTVPVVKVTPSNIKVTPEIPNVEVPVVKPKQQVLDRNMFKIPPIRGKIRAPVINQSYEGCVYELISKNGNSFNRHKISINGGDKCFIFIKWVNSNIEVYDYDIQGSSIINTSTMRKLTITVLDKINI